MNITKLKNGKYRAREMYQGRTYSKNYPYKPSLKEARKDMQNLISIESNIKNIKFETCINTYIESKQNILSPSSIRRYRLHIINIPDKILKTNIYNIDNLQLQYMINNYAKTHKAKTTKDFYGFLKAVLTLYTNKKFKIILPPIHKTNNQYIPTKEEVMNILEVAKGTQYEIPILLASYGMRIGEIIALEMDNIENGEIIINKTQTVDENNHRIIKTPKTVESNRIIKVPTYITDLIKQKKEIYNSTANAINRFLFKTERKLNINKFSIHKLRHFFATELHFRNIPSKYIQAMGGWATDNVMKSVYIHANKDIETINIFD